jgi:hypothetical protein
MNKLEQQQQKLSEIKSKSRAFAQGIKEEIAGLVNDLDYVQSSVFSYNIDRIDHFLKELVEFELKT